MDISLAIARLEESTEKCSGITDNISTNNYENVKSETTIEGQIKSSISILDNQINTDAFSSGMEETSSSKTFYPFSLQSNVSEPSEQSSKSSSVTPLVQGSKYIFYDDNGKKFIIDNADFEEEEQELIDIFNSNPTVSHNNPLENLSYNEACHFYPISTNASKEDEGAEENVYYDTEEDVKENIVDSSQKKNIFRKMKSFFKKVRKDKRIGVSYQKFK
ncbi:hypothetical protein TNCT_464401 [Trichonephila clavata]|uniref:Uncharacterized protein n=1 Tax=Trichonephila clavata TaxID=2740835 RepID=A0A8X6JFW2_TRICU|nr:hypothetical protein TNCT_464401 [Trichonephila clavata]